MARKRTIRPFYRVLVTCPAGHETYCDSRTLNAAYNNWKLYADFQGWFAYQMIKINLYTGRQMVLRNVLD